MSELRLLVLGLLLVLFANDVRGQTECSESSRSAEPTDEQVYVKWNQAAQNLMNLGAGPSDTEVISVGMAKWNNADCRDQGNGRKAYPQFVANQTNPPDPPLVELSIVVDSDVSPTGACAALFGAQDTIVIYEQVNIGGTLYFCDWNDKDYAAAAIAHELGHYLGLGHPDRPSSGPIDCQGVMAAGVNSSGQAQDWEFSSNNNRARVPLPTYDPTGEECEKAADLNRTPSEDPGNLFADLNPHPGQLDPDGGFGLGPHSGCLPTMDGFCSFAAIEILRFAPDPDASVAGGLNIKASSATPQQACESEGKFWHPVAICVPFTGSGSFSPNGDGMGVRVFTTVLDLATREVQGALHDADGVAGFLAYLDGEPLAMSGLLTGLTAPCLGCPANSGFSFLIEDTLENGAHVLTLVAADATPHGDPGRHDFAFTVSDNTAPANLAASVQSTAWVADGTTVHQLEVSARDDASGVDRIRAMINYQGSNSSNRRGYFIWDEDGYGTADDRVVCAGGGFGAKHPSATWGADHITLVGCSTTFQNGVREVVFDVVPEISFGTFGAINDVSVRATDEAGNVRNWQNKDLNFSSSVVSSNPPQVVSASTNRTDWTADGYRSYILQVELTNPPTGYSEVELSINKGRSTERGTLSWANSGVPKHSGEMRLCPGGGNISIDPASPGAAKIGIQSCISGVVANGNLIVRAAVRPSSTYGNISDNDVSIRTVEGNGTSSSWEEFQINATALQQSTSDSQVPLVSIAGPTVDQVVSGSIVVSGWSLDTSGVDSTVFRVAGSTAPFSGEWRGSTWAGACTAYPSYDDPHCPYVGISATLDTNMLLEGHRTIDIESIDARGQSRHTTRRVYVDNDPDSVQTIWAQPQSLSGIGPPGSLTIAGLASGAEFGTTVLVQYRNLTTGGGWLSTSSTVPDSGDSWYAYIPNANFSHTYEIRGFYGIVPVPLCTYNSGGAFQWCP